VEDTKIAINQLQAKDSLQQTMASLEAKCLLQAKYEMFSKITMFNVEDKRNLTMEGEVFF